MAGYWLIKIPASVMQLFIDTCGQIRQRAVICTSTCVAGQENTKPGEATEKHVVARLKTESALMSGHYQLMKRVL